MADTVIRAEGLGKHYRIGEREAYGTLRDAIARAAHPGRWLQRRRQGDAPTGHDLWALRDVSFTVERGEVLGIIGRNGAGKSTLLKILSRITRPTTGWGEVRGRVASLLEVGTGFHGELTGRENVYLNGAILGMSKADITARFDEILAFAEIERFVDTPVKRYSSGMYLRLAFAVAAHLEPDVLIVDEVLAVGDADFQKKCLGKMRAVSSQGRTVLFVSHNLPAVTGLCSSAMLMASGRVTDRGDPGRVVQRYLDQQQPAAEGDLSSVHSRKGCGPVRFTRLSCADPTGGLVKTLVSGRPYELRLAFTNDAPNRCQRDVQVAIAVYNSSGFKITNLSTHYFTDTPTTLDHVSSGEFVCHIPRLPFRSGVYNVELFCAVGGAISDWLSDVRGFDVSDGDYYGTGRLTNPNQGTLFMEHSWSLSPAAST